MQYDNGETTIESGHIYGPNGITEDDSATGSITVLNGTIEATNGTAISSKSALVLGTDDGSVSITSPSIVGTTYGINSTGTIEFNDGLVMASGAAIETTSTIITPSEKNVAYDTLGSYLRAHLNYDSIITYNHADGKEITIDSMEKGSIVCNNTIGTRVGLESSSNGWAMTKQGDVGKHIWGKVTVQSGCVTIPRIDFNDVTIAPNFVDYSNGIYTLYFDFEITELMVESFYETSLRFIDIEHNNTSDVVNIDYLKVGDSLDSAIELQRTTGTGKIECNNIFGTRITIINSKNGWTMTTNGDMGKHISGKIKVKTAYSRSAPVVDFNDRIVKPYKTEYDGTYFTLYVDFDITQDMLTNTSVHPYATSYRFIDVECRYEIDEVTVEYLVISDTTETATAVNGEPLSIMPIPTKSGYTFNGYYTERIVREVGTSISTFVNSANRFDSRINTTSNWKWTASGDVGKQIFGQIVVNYAGSDQPTIDFNDKNITPYKATHIGNAWIFNIAFDVTESMLSGIYETSYRFIDVEAASGYATVTSVNLYEGEIGEQYYNSDGTPTQVSDFTSDTTLYAHWIPVEKANYSVDSNLYETLIEAYDAISGDVGSKTGTIIVERDNTDSSTFVITSGDIIVLDTNTHTITKVSSEIQNNGTLTINGNGTIQTEEAEINTLNNIIANTGNLTINGSTFENKGTTMGEWRVLISYTGTVTVNDGLLKTSLTSGVSNSDSNSDVITTVNNTDLYINGGKIWTDASLANGKGKYAIENNGNSGDVYINGGIIESTYSIALMLNNCSGDVYINNCTITGGDDAVRVVNNATSTVYIGNNSTLISGANGVGNNTNSTAKVIVGTSGDGEVSTTSPVIQGETYGISGDFEFYDGIILGGTYAINGDVNARVTAKPDGYMVKIGESGDYETATLAGQYTVNFHPNILPDEYMQVEYIEGTGEQYIDTGVAAKASLKTKLKFNLTKVAPGVIYGYAIDDITDYRFFNAREIAYLDLPDPTATGVGRRISGGTISVGTTYELEIGNNYVKDLITNSDIISGDYVDFADRTETLRICNGKFYYLKIYDGDTLIRDFIPCYRKADNTGGLYD